MSRIGALCSATRTLVRSLCKLWSHPRTSAGKGGTVLRLTRCLALSGDEFSYSPLSLPKLDRVTVDQLVGVFLGALVVRASQQTRSQHAAVLFPRALSVPRHLSVL